MAFDDLQNGVVAVARTAITLISCRMISQNIRLILIWINPYFIYDEFFTNKSPGLWVITIYQQ